METRTILVFKRQKIGATYSTGSIKVDTYVRN